MSRTVAGEAPERTSISYALTVSLAGIVSLMAAFHMPNRGLLCLTPCRLRGGTNTGVVTSRQSKQTLFGEGVGDFRNGPDFRGPPAVKIIHRKIHKIKNATTITRIVIALENVARMTICARESSVGLSFR